MRNEEINEALRSYVQKNLTPTPEERRMVAGVYAAICSVLGRARCYQIGSYPRFTAIRPPHDLDVLYIAGDWPGAAPDDATILVELRTRLQTELEVPAGLTFIVGLQTHSITVSFYRGAEEIFAVDVVPAWTTGTKNEFGEDIYRVTEILLRGHHARLRAYKRLAEHGGQIDFILSDPKGYISVAATVNSVNGDFRKSVKFAKKWKWSAKQDDEDFKLKSFHIEQILTLFFLEDPRLDLVGALTRFFRELPQWISRSQIRDRADHTRYIDAYVNELTPQQRSAIIAARDRFTQGQGLLESVDRLEALLTGSRPRSAVAAAGSSSVSGSPAVVTDRRSVAPRAPFGG